MARLRLTVAARRGLLGIGRYTLDRWGEDQCVTYLTELDRRFRTLVDNPHSGRACDEIRPGCWRARQGRHVIFYRFDAKEVVIVRILHERMIPERHL
jgi:toxin ParE1/3/4